MVLKSCFGFLARPLIAQMHPKLSDVHKVGDGETGTVVGHNEAKNAEQSLAVCRVWTDGENMDCEAVKRRHVACSCCERLPEIDWIDTLALSMI